MGLELQVRHQESRCSRDVRNLQELSDLINERTLPEGHYTLLEAAPGKMWNPVMVIIVKDNDGDRTVKMFFT